MLHVTWESQISSILMGDLPGMARSDKGGANSMITNVMARLSNVASETHLPGITNGYCQEECEIP